MVRSSGRRMFVWAAFVGLLLGFGRWKDAESRADRQRQSDWHAEIEKRRIEGRKKYDKVLEWMRTASSENHTRQAFEQRFNGEYTLTSQREKGQDIETWVHPKYGITVEVTFQGEQVVTTGAGFNFSNIERAYPAPPIVRYTSLAERIRSFAASWLAWAWAPLFPIALYSRRRGPVAAQISFAIAMAYAVALLTAPNYSLTTQGIFSNDGLVWAAFMFLCSVVLLALRSPTSFYQLRRIRFRVGGILLLTAMCAIAAASGPLGLVAIISLGVGALVYLTVLALKAPTVPSGQDWRL